MFSKHQTSTTLLSFEQGNRATLPLSCSLCAVSTSTPKPRAEGSSPSAPAKNREASTMLASLFFVSAHKDSATRHGCALRSACRGVSERQWRSAANRPRRQPRPSPSAPAKKPAKTLGLLPLPKNRRKHWVFAGFLFSCVALLSGAFWFGFLVSHPSAPAAPLPSTRNAPGFALFGPNRVRFSLFRCFLAAKFLPWFLCNLPHSVYKLKPSVIPCKREVSFLT